MGVGIHVERVRSIEIDPETEIVCVKIRSNGESVSLHLPLREYRDSVDMAVKALGRHDDRAKVVPLRRH